MIAEYKGQYFCVDLSVNPIELWRYDAVSDFNKCIDDGLVYYSKFVDISAVDQIFCVGFSVNWDGDWCGVSYSAEKNLLGVGTNDRDFAMAHGMEEFERGTFDCALPADQFTEYRMWIRDVINKTESFTMVSFDDFKRLWKEMIADLIAPR